VFTAPVDREDAPAPPGLPLVAPISAPAVEDQVQPTPAETPSQMPPPSDAFAPLDQQGMVAFAVGEPLPSHLPGQIRAVLAMIGLGFCVLQALAVLGIATLARSQPEAGQADHAFVLRLLAQIQLPAELITPIFFLVWLYNAHANLRLLQARNLEYSPGWAVTYFFIPILNWFRPYQVAQEIYRASNPHLPSDRANAWRAAGGSTVIGWWWAMWLIRLFLSGSFRPFARPRAGAHLDDLQFSSALTIAAGVCAILMIRQIRNRQTQRFENLTTLERTAF